MSHDVAGWLRKLAHEKEAGILGKDCLRVAASAWEREHGKAQASTPDIGVQNTVALLESIEKARMLGWLVGIRLMLEKDGDRKSASAAVSRETGISGSGWIDTVIKDVAQAPARSAKVEAVIEAAGSAVQAWDRGWDCSRSPGHREVSDAVALLTDALAALDGEAKDGA